MRGGGDRAALEYPQREAGYTRSGYHGRQADVVMDAITTLLCRDGRHHDIRSAASRVSGPATPSAADATPTGNRVWSEPGRLMAAGGIQFLNGGTTAANGELLAYRFLKPGRYLVICMNRSHFLNDWMFGFVNVVGVD